METVILLVKECDDSVPIYFTVGKKNPILDSVVLIVIIIIMIKKLC